MPRLTGKPPKAARVTQQRQLDYYHLTAPFAGVVEDIPVRVGDYVSPTTLLTTVDENAELEAYVYIPTEKAGDIKMGLPIQIVNSAGELLESYEDQFHLPAGGQCIAGNSCESADQELTG